MYQPKGFSCPDIESAFYDFLVTFFASEVPAENIIRGWENRYSLPPDTNEYIVYSLSDSHRVGTNEETKIADDGTFTMTTIFEGRVQIDFCSDSEKSRAWAAYCDSVVRSDVGVAFFNARGFSTLYADEAISTEYVDGSKQYVKRTVLNVKICYNVVSIFGTEYAIAVVPRIEDVDEHHKPL